MKNHCLSKSEIETKLREAGVQPTAQRIAIGQFVLCEADHPTADEVKAWADQNFTKMSLATVYNTLNILVSAGLLREFRFPHSDKVFYDQNLSVHYHFLDEKTGKLWDLEEKEVSIRSRLSSSFQVKGVDLVFRGVKR